MESLKGRLARARELFLNGDIDSADYKSIKSEAEQKILIIEDNLLEIKDDGFSVGEVSRLLDDSLAKLTKLNLIYSGAEPEVKREIIGSIFPSKFTFSELKHRTASINPTSELIYLINKKLEGKKKGQSRIFLLCPMG
ncbi:MAG: hypothetical protein JKY70_04115 [Mucilaginibacter sp.]|nr:hypothetical protein [Mucilaginibacter sp.]